MKKMFKKISIPSIVVFISTLCLLLSTVIILNGAINKIYGVMWALSALLLIFMFARYLAHSKPR